jgi:hypothetical protein
VASPDGYSTSGGIANKSKRESFDPYERSASLSVVDCIVEKGGQTLAIEVKTRGAIRNGGQLAKDAAMESTGRRVGASGGSLAGQILKLKTIEMRPF